MFKHLAFLALIAIANAEFTQLNWKSCGQGSIQLDEIDITPMVITFMYQYLV